ncbi:MAG: hypothetical protein AAF383_09305 [Cyanobacteria bacterium P01_A01_bin.83]
MQLSILASLFHRLFYSSRNKRLTLIILFLLLGLAVKSCAYRDFGAVVSSINEDDHPQEPTIKATLTETSRPLNAKLACFNVNSVTIPSWRDRDLGNIVQQLNAKILRLPGGTVANYWDWRRGGIIEDTTSLPKGLPNFLKYKARRYQASRLEDIQTGLKLSNTEPIFVLNMLTSNLNSQIEMLKRASELGMKVKYIELGNEFYFNIRNYKKFFPTPQDYAAKAKLWITAIKQEFPQSEISVVGVVPETDKPKRLQYWNKHLLNQVADISDAVSLHIYESHGLESRVAPKLKYPFFESEEVSTILGEPFRIWQITQERDAYQLIPDEMNLWITEYNFIEKATVPGHNFDRRVTGSWAHGLYALEMALLFLEDQRIKVICNHSLLGNPMFQAVYADELSGNINSSSPFKLSATGLVLQLFNESIEGMSNARKIDFSQDLQLVGKDNYSYPALYGWLFDNSVEQRALIVNLSDQVVNLNMEGLMSQGIKYEMLHATPRTLVKSTRSVKRKQGNINKTFKLSPYAIAKFSG